MSNVNTKNLVTGAKAVMKKVHPCGSNLFLITRTGADVKLKCLGCNHVIMLDLVKALKSIKVILPPDPQSST
ncbi:MAG TPA: DUF951 domain-containing protein [Clostridia bacterium]|jgi:hypothetical protein